MPIVGYLLKKNLLNLLDIPSSSSSWFLIWPTSHAVLKANQILGMIKRNFVDRSSDTIITLYKSSVRPHLKYCSQIWSPHLMKDIKLIERVQRRATKLVQGIEHLSYDERLQYVGLTRLGNRRKRSDLIETYKIHHYWCVRYSERFIFTARQHSLLR